MVSTFDVMGHDVEVFLHSDAEQQGVHDLLRVHFRHVTGCYVVVCQAAPECLPHHCHECQPVPLTPLFAAGPSMTSASCPGQGRALMCWLMPTGILPQTG